MNAFVCLLLGGCAIGFAPIFVRLSDTGPVASAFWRVALAAPVMWIWLFMSPRTLQSQRWSGAQWIVVLCGLLFALDLAAWHWSIVWTSVANATLLANLAPIVVTLAGWLLWKQQVTKVFLMGMIVALVGMFVLVGPNFLAGGTHLLGDALAALTAVFYGSYMLAIKRARDAGAPTAPLMAWSTTITAVALFPVALLFPQPVLPASAGGWLVLLGLALVTQILGQGLIAYAFAHLPASLSSVSLLVQPVVAALAAWLLFAEAVGPAQWIGGAIVLAGIWIAKRAS